MKNLCKLLICIFSSLLLFGCGGNKSSYGEPLPMLVPHQIHEALKINILDFKVVSDSTTIPKVRQPGSNAKYIAIRIQATNPGEHRGRPTAVFGRIVEKAYIDHPSFRGRPAPLFMQGMFESLSEYRSGARGILFQELKPGDSMTGWLIGILPKDANPPYTLQIKPSKRVGRVIPIQVALNSF